MKLKKVVAAGLFTAMLAGSCLCVSAAPAPTPAAASQLTEEQAGLILNVEAYKQAYPDLAAAFGNNTKAYINHYLTHGIYEGRTKGALFDPLTYAEAYGDIRAAFGYDINALVNHYVNFGVAEKRTMGTSHGYADIASAESSGMANYYIPKAIAASYENFVPVGNSASAGSNMQNAQTSGGSSLASTWNYDRSNAIYGDNNTLLRVEYYDASGKLIRYSSVDKVDNSTNSYTETIYYYDDKTEKDVVDRVDTYVNGVLHSSAPGSD